MPEETPPVTPTQEPAPVVPSVPPSNESVTAQTTPPPPTTDTAVSQEQPEEPTSTSSKKLLFAIIALVVMVLLAAAFFIFTNITKKQPTVVETVLTPAPVATATPTPAGGLTQGNSDTDLTQDTSTLDVSLTGLGQQDLSVSQGLNDTAPNLNN